MELGKVPARNLADYIVECRFEECRSCLGDRVLEVEESVSETQLGCHKGERITCCL